MVGHLEHVSTVKRTRRGVDDGGPPQLRVGMLLEVGAQQRDVLTDTYPHDDGGVVRADGPHRLPRRRTLLADQRGEVGQAALHALIGGREGSDLGKGVLCTKPESTVRRHQLGGGRAAGFQDLKHPREFVNARSLHRYRLTSLHQREELVAVQGGCTSELRVRAPLDDLSETRDVVVVPVGGDHEADVGFWRRSDAFQMLQFRRTQVRRAAAPRRQLTLGRSIRPKGRRAWKIGPPRPTGGHTACRPSGSGSSWLTATPAPTGAIPSPGSWARTPPRSTGCWPATPGPGCGNSTSLSSGGGL